MSDDAPSREVLRRALELNVLEPDDVRGAAPVALAPAVRGALERLVARTPRRSATERPVSLELANGAAFSTERSLPQAIARAVSKRTGHATRCAGEADDAGAQLALLDQADREAVEEAAWCRTAMRLGLVARETIDGCRGEAGRIEERLVERGALDVDAAMRVFAERCQARRACGSCLELLGRDQAACPRCGAARERTRDGESERDTIAGFPGPGGRFAGYEILERIAEGGMGVVFKVRQVQLNRVVALKVLRGGNLASETRRRRFLLEAEAQATLKHPGIVVVHEISEVSGYPYYTMDLVDGCALNVHVASRRLDSHAIACLVGSVADAVHHCHLHGVIHRDLKPENVLVGKDGVPRVIDFGIAKRMGDESATVDGDLLGTLHYMSPEQAAGHSREVDVRTDVYALGAILYELLAEAPPFHDLDGARLVVAIQQDDPAPVRVRNPSVEPDLEAIVAKAMAREPERRYQSAAELAADLDRFERRLPVAARPATIRYRVRKAIRRRLPAAIGVGVALVFTLVGVAAEVVATVRERRAIESLLVAAADATRPASEREKLLERVLFEVPDHEAARARLLVLQGERRSAEALARREEAQRRELLEARFAREHAEREACASRERDTARTEAEKATSVKAALRASTLLERALAEPAELTALHFLGEALAVVPASEKGLRRRIEDRKIELALHQASAALAEDQTGLAEFWLAEIRKLDAARERTSELDALASRVQDYARGRRDLEQARALIAGGDLIGARARLDQARLRGIPAETVEKDLAIVRRASLERARVLVDEGRACLARGEAAKGLARADEARSFEPDSEDARALATDCEARIAQDAMRSAAALWARRDDRRRALAVLDAAASTVHDAGRARTLRAEREARARLLSETGLAGLILVPAVADLGVEAVYVQETPVTNADFERFVSARGYFRAELWDEAARDKVGSFHDGCPGGGCAHRAPRTWVDGKFGDPSNAERPVTGVTFHEARAYARWLSSTTGATWRLPTEKELEVAAGWDPATSRSRLYPWGDRFESGALASGRVPEIVGHARLDVSPLGLRDGGGNVREWVERAGGDAGTKGADHACDEASARHYALVRTTGAPGPSPSLELVKRIGFRLVREIEVSR